MLVPVMIARRAQIILIAIGALLIAAMLAPLLAVLSTPAASQQVATPETIRIATWNLNASLPAKLQSKFRRRKAIWRTTFGPKKKKTATGKIGQLKVEADLIALQSVVDLRIVRRLFPARQFHIVVSRQLLLNAGRIRKSRARSGAGETGAGSDKTGAGNLGTTAIVLRRASGWRLTRQQHLLRFAGRALKDPNAPPQVAVIAVRLARGSKALWLASIDLAPPCKLPATSSAGLTAKSAPLPAPAPVIASRRKNKTQCAARAKQLRLLRQWIIAKRKLGEPVIIAGSFSGALGPDLRRVLQQDKRQLHQFPSKREAGKCRDATRAKAGNIGARAADHILVDDPASGTKPTATKSWLMANPHAAHCPVLLDLTL